MALDPATVSDTLGVLLKYQDDIARIDEPDEGDRSTRCRAELARGGWRVAKALGHRTEPDAALPGGRIADNIVHFARTLRAAGLPVGPAA